MSTPSHNQPYEFWIDFIRSIAAFMVVCLHAAAPWLYKYGEIPIEQWRWANIIDSTMRSCVPLFFMLAGYLLIKPGLQLVPFFQKRVSRIVIPLLTWSVIYLVWRIPTEPSTFGWKTAVRYFINGPVVTHLWFLYALIGMYLFIPVLIWATENSTGPRSKYFIILWLTGSSIFPFISKSLNILVGWNALEPVLPFTNFGSYAGYLLLGKALGQYQPTKKLLTGVFLLFCTTTIFTIIATEFETQRANIFVGYFYEYLALNVVGMSLSIFILLKEFGGRIEQIKVLKTLCKRVSVASFGIYLVHPLFLTWIITSSANTNIVKVFNHPAITVLAIAVTTFVASYLFSEIILKIPVIKHII